MLEDTFGGAAKVGEIEGAAAEWAAGDFLANGIKFPRHFQSISNGPSIDDFLRNESKDFFEPDTVVRPFETDDAVSILLFLVSDSSCGRPAPDSAISSDRVGAGMDCLSSQLPELSQRKEEGKSLEREYSTSPFLDVVKRRD